MENSIVFIFLMEIFNDFRIYSLDRCYKDGSKGSWSQVSQVHTDGYLTIYHQGILYPLSRLTHRGKCREKNPKEK